MHPEQLQDDLLVKYFLKWCTGDEEEMVASWLEADDGNRLYYDNLVDSEKLTGIMDGIHKIDIDQKWEMFQKEHVSKRSNIIPLYDSEPEHESTFPLFTLKRAISIAASIMIVLGISVGMHYRNGDNVIGQKKIVVHENSRRAFELAADNTTDSVKAIELPDQSLVRLSPKSKFTYKEQSGKNTRELSLVGKARFTIYKDASRPFTVYSGDIATTALGTEFTVTHIEKDKTITVRLYEGKVVIRTSAEAMIKMKQDYYLYPTQEFVYNRNSLGGTVRSFVTTPPATVTTRKAKIPVPLDNPGHPQLGRESWFMFNNRPLDEVFKQLEEMYEVDIEYSKSDFSKTYLIGTFNKSDSLERILTQITRLNDLKMTKKENKYIIKK